MQTALFYLTSGTSWDMTPAKFIWMCFSYQWTLSTFFCLTRASDRLVAEIFFPKMFKNHVFGVWAIFGLNGRRSGWDTPSLIETSSKRHFNQLYPPWTQLFPKEVGAERSWPPTPTCYPMLYCLKANLGVSAYFCTWSAGFRKHPNLTPTSHQSWSVQHIPEFFFQAFWPISGGF